MTLTINGQVIPLDHLQPIQRSVELELRGNIRKIISVEFRFSCHCYSRGPSEGEAIPAGEFVPDGSPAKPRNRIFDQRRYDLSKQLIGFIDLLIASNSIVTKSRQDNFFRVDSIQSQTNGIVTSVPYFIFMHARKTQEPNRPKSIKVHVESAYPEQPGIPHPAGRGSKTFGAMLGEAW